MDIFLYTDGGRRGRVGAWSVVAQTACKPELKVVEGGVVRDVTHQEMEVTAALKAVEWGFAESPKARLTIISDSYYVVGCFEHEWHVKWEQRGWRTSSGPGEVSGAVEAVTQPRVFDAMYTSVCPCSRAQRASGQQGCR